MNARSRMEMHGAFQIGLPDWGSVLNSQVSEIGCLRDGTTIIPKWNGPLENFDTKKVGLSSPPIIQALFNTSCLVSCMKRRILISARVWINECIRC